jgi:hypothetical protein
VKGDVNGATQSIPEVKVEQEVRELGRKSLNYGKSIKIPYLFLLSRHDCTPAIARSRGHSGIL